MALSFHHRIPAHFAANKLSLSLSLGLCLYPSLPPPIHMVGTLIVNSHSPRLEGGVEKGWEGKGARRSVESLNN